MFPHGKMLGKGVFRPYPTLTYPTPLIDMFLFFLQVSKEGAHSIKNPGKEPKVSRTSRKGLFYCLPLIIFWPRRRAPLRCIDLGLSLDMRESHKILNRLPFKFLLYPYFSIEVSLYIVLSMKVWEVNVSLLRLSFLFSPMGLRSKM